MKKIMFSLLLIIMLLVISGCPLKTPPIPQKEEPKFAAELKPSEENIRIQDENFHPIKITATQVKEFDKLPIYTIKLVSPNSDLIYFQNNIGQRIENITTQQFENINDVKNYDISIIGKITDGQNSAKYTVVVKLFDQDENQVGPDTNIKIEVFKK